MKLTRRDSILGFVTFLIGLNFRRRSQLVQTEFSNSLVFNQALMTPNSLPRKEIDTAQIYDDFLGAAALGFEDHPALLYQGIGTSPYKKQITY
ncbi:hypothetical protein G7B40_035070 [Aetokthonos hydrillicola Thurmond2011]|jgi:hypothetical protein|uniref:Uncharacterized protein n=1 Tax=Aetokthonos hydrillicola Thurmond2011 TaxID=2712845 RepID=A0AAP5IGV1_9CYAN|nr:hypothetical protein [Aetokthonos hydrillicola]MBO3463884.1 hypothetical protein [Aetokthonos hydrillicola CCALA 1050]MBW4590429.1 hypothetical protein [Aetokthonos hydrillicola CCALA 1050]MDR9899743.1 hypothetical protein [Aetokthonos hydrillicola Thurmond2011]